MHKKQVNQFMEIDYADVYPVVWKVCFRYVNVQSCIVNGISSGVWNKLNIANRRGNECVVYRTYFVIFDDYSGEWYWLKAWCMFIDNNHSVRFRWYSEAFIRIERHTHYMIWCVAHYKKQAIICKVTYYITLASESVLPK